MADNPLPGETIPEAFGFFPEEVTADMAISCVDFYYACLQRTEGDMQASTQLVAFFVNSLIVRFDTVDPYVDSSVPDVGETDNGSI